MATNFGMDCEVLGEQMRSGASLHPSLNSIGPTRSANKCEMAGELAWYANRVLFIIEINWASGLCSILEHIIVFCACRTQ